MSRYIRIKVEAGNGDTVYLSNEHLQSFDTKEQQLEEQVPIFKAIADAVMEASMKGAEEFPVVEKQAEFLR